MAQFISYADITTGNVLKTFASCFLTYYVTSVIYTRYFHSLSAFPGPFWASISNFWKLWILSTTESHTRALDYHKAYGNVHHVLFMLHTHG
jgi:hypothetical protein